MRLATSEMNKGVVIEKSNLEQAINRYKILHSNACYKLYNMYYLSSPSVFSLYEFVKAFRQEFRDYFSLFVSDLDSTIDWSTKRCEYAIAVAKAKGYSEDFIELLYVVRDIFHSRESLEALNSLKSRCKLNQKARLTDTVVPRLSVSTQVRDASFFKCDSKAVSETFQRATNSEFIHLSTKSAKLECALKELNIPQEEIDKVKASGMAFFSSCLSQEDELYFLEYFLSGAVTADGIYAEVLAERLSQDNEYHVSARGNITKVVPFVETVFVNSVNARIEIANKKREELNKNYSNIHTFFVNDDEIIFEVANEPFMYNTNAFKVPTMLGGTFLIDYKTGGSYPMYNMFSGYVGEYISEVDIFENKYYAEGKPVKLKFLEKTSRGIKQSVVNAYNIADVYYSDERNASGELITKTLDSKYSERNFEVSDSLRSLVYRNSNESLYYTIRKQVTSTMLVDDNIREGYLDLVADLVCAMIIIKVKGEFYILQNTGYDYITESLYNMACYEANEIMSTL